MDIELEHQDGEHIATVWANGVLADSDVVSLQKLKRIADDIYEYIDTHTGDSDYNAAEQRADHERDMK